MFENLPLYSNFAHRINHHKKHGLFQEQRQKTQIAVNAQMGDIRSGADSRAILFYTQDVGKQGFQHHRPRNPRRQGYRRQRTQKHNLHGVQPIAGRQIFPYWRETRLGRSENDTRLLLPAIQG